MFWAFAGGAASSILEDLKARNASEMETKEYEKRLKMQEKIRAAAEEAQRANRIYNQTEDLERGKLIEMTVGGERREFDLPKEYVQQQQSARGLAAEKERIEQERKQREFEAKVAKDEAAAISSQRRADADMIRAGRTSTLMEYDRARTEKERTTPPAEDKEAKRDAERAERKTEVEIGAAYREAAKHPDARVQAAARQIRFDTSRSPEEKLAILAELANSE